MRKIFLLLIGAFLFSAPHVRADECIYVVTNTLTITWSDSNGTVSQSTTYYMGWICFSGPSSYIIDDPGSGVAPTPAPQPSSGGGCTVSICQANCDAEYAEAIAGEFADTEIGGATWYKCGPICMDLAASDRNACYAYCIEDCH